MTREFPLNSTIKFSFSDAVERLKVIECNDTNKCSKCRFRKVALRHCMTGRIEEWGCRFQENERYCNNRVDGNSIIYINA